MNPSWFGDSYDIVKRFFVGELHRLGYTVYVEPMWTGESGSAEISFVRFLGATHVAAAEPSEKSALLIDPDTGIGRRRSKSHTTLRDIVDRLAAHELAVVFDQSFSRGLASEAQISAKLRRLRELDAYGFYYDSHARFLFCSRADNVAETVRGALVELGLPEWRLVQPG